MTLKYQLKAKDVHRAALQNAQKHLPLTAHGYQCDTTMLFNVLFKAATENVSIETASRDLKNVIGGNTLREYLSN